jgi:glycosyltransferase involved in cell wall biosynthesis
MILGIDASTPGSGGARRHLIELLKFFDTQKYGFTNIRIWGVQTLLQQLPDKEGVEKITHPMLNKGFIHRTIWQLFYRESAIKGKCDILFSPFGTYSGSIKPYVSMSQNMLIFDKAEQARFGLLSWMRLKLWLLNRKQKKSFVNAQGIIFLSHHAQNMILQYVDLRNTQTSIIHHGVSDMFMHPPKYQLGIREYDYSNPYRILFVSTIWEYKHPWNLVAAVASLRKKYPVLLDIVGNVEQKEAGKKLAISIREHKADSFVNWHTSVSLNEVHDYYKKADLFVFPSTCENMPNILIEAMSAGLPIAASQTQPMPEFLANGGIYFNALNPADIANVIEQLLVNPAKRAELSESSYILSKQYNWKKCADETFSFLHTIAKTKICLKTKSY